MNEQPTIDRSWLALAMLNELHSNVPEDDRPMSLSDLSDEQAERAVRAVDRVLDLLAKSSASPFRRGVRAAIQAAVDDISALVKRRKQAAANDTTTQIIIGVARRIANLPMPLSEEDGAQPVDRMVMLSKVARMMSPELAWDKIAAIGPEGQFYDDKGMELEASHLMRGWWQRADEIVTLTRYA